MPHGLCAETWPPDPRAVRPGASRCLFLPQFQAGHMQGPQRLPLTSGTHRQPVEILTSPCFPQQVTKAHEPPREDTAPPAPVTPQHLQPESIAPQQSGSSPRGKSRSPVPSAEKEGECPRGWGTLGVARG